MAIECNECGSRKTQVEHTRQVPRGTRRHRRCINCGHRFLTLEIDEGLFRFITVMERLFDKFSVELRKEGKGAKKRSHLSRAEIEARKRGGWRVPEEQLEDWGVLRKAGYTPDEAAKSLKLQLFSDWQKDQRRLRKVVDVGKMETQNQLSESKEKQP